VTRDLPTLRDISVAPRECRTLRFERRYAARISTRPSWWPLALVALTSAASGCGLVWWLGTLARGGL
jgi:hypothetical protein